MPVLGIETSCDETGVALLADDGRLLSHAVYSQQVHSEYGGVVPELASRDHVRKTLPMIHSLMREVGVAASDLSGIAYTAGPGLIGALLVGAAVGRSMAWAAGIPAVGVHHLEGHLLAPMLEPEPPAFPFLALLVSGGHTLLVAVDGVGAYRILGQSLDDAAGEAFDKTAKLLSLPYPGGPALAALAEEGDPQRYRFPRPMTDRPGLDFSFSGLKTHALNTLRYEGEAPAVRAAVARAFEDAVVDTLAIKCRRALESTGLGRLVVAGGVGANRRLRQRLETVARTAGVSLHFPRLELCTDNAAMIAQAGLLRLRAGEAEGPSMQVRARWPLDELQPPGAG